jgi:FixJ family two-component response regulator
MKSDEIHELEQQMDALAREYAATHDQEIITKLEELSRRLRELADTLVEAGKNKLH